MAPVRSRSIFMVMALTTLALGSPAWLYQRSIALGDTHVVRVAESQSEEFAALRLSPTRELDYQTFAWLELTPEDLTTLEGSGVGFHERCEPFTLRLGGLTFDPLEAEPLYPAGWGDPGTQGAELHLVQFFGPTRDEWFADLESRGLEVVQYIHPYMYVMWGSASARDDLATVETVRWAGPHATAYRVQSSLRSLSSDLQDVIAVIYAGADTDACVTALESLGATLIGRGFIDATFETARFSMPGTLFQAAAGVPGVYSLQTAPTLVSASEMSSQVCANNIDPQSALPVPGYQAWLQGLVTGLGLSGADVRIAHVDHCPDPTHPDLINNVSQESGGLSIGDVYCDGLWFSEPGNDIQLFETTNPHGTQTAGVILGDGASGAVDEYGFTKGLGVAPGAKMFGIYSGWVNDRSGDGGDGLRLVMEESVKSWAHLSNNSWSLFGHVGYDLWDRIVDAGVRDARPGFGHDFPLTYVNAVPNTTSSDPGELASPDQAKNALHVGSTNMRDDSGAPTDLYNDLSPRTAYGPASDGRLIPHLVAPGVFVLSTDLGGGYALRGGNSMACPQVSGAVALFIEYWWQAVDWETTPSPAMVKAALLAVAKDLAGHKDKAGNILGHRPDNKQGWGRLDVEAVLDPPYDVVYVDQTTIFHNTGEQWGLSVVADDPGQPMKIMLVWTDAPGTPGSETTPAWVNDLYLLVVRGTDEYTGNCFNASDGWSQPWCPTDHKNNTEAVFFGPTASTEAAEIYVIAANISGDGVPWDPELDPTDQDFALVCYNCVARPGDPKVAPFPHDRRKNRYISFDPNKVINDGEEIAFKVELTDITLGSCATTGAPCRTDRLLCDSSLVPCTMDQDCPDWEYGEECSAIADCGSCLSVLEGPFCMYNGECEPGQTCTLFGNSCFNDKPTVGGSNIGHIWWLGPEHPSGNGVHLMVTEPFRKISADWPNPTHVGDCEIVPLATYGVRAVDVNSSAESAELSVSTIDKPGNTWWADCVGEATSRCNGEENRGRCNGNGDSCYLDADCPPGQPCVLHMCLELSQSTLCSTDGDCATGEVCVRNHCGNPLDICENSGDCPPAPFACAPTNACNNDGQCGSGEVCQTTWDPPDGAVNVNDIQGAVRHIAGAPSLDVTWFDLHGADSVLPGSHRFDPPNFEVNMGDVQFMVMAFQGLPYPFNDPGDCPDVGAWPSNLAPPPPPGSPEFTLVANGDLFDPSEDVQVDVYISEATNVYAQEVALEVTGGTAGSLMVSDITVDTDRSDYVFYGVSDTPIEAKNQAEMRVGSCLQAAGPGVTKIGAAYLATYTFQPSGGATGVFEINASGQGKSFLLSPNGSTQVTDTSGTAVVGFGVDCLNDSHCDDNEECTTDSCTANNECQYDNVASGTACDDGLWCTRGAQTCDGNGLCTGGAPRCPPGYLCDEGGQQCFGGAP